MSDLFRAGEPAMRHSPPAPAPRHAQLVSAAQILLTWVYARRATWPGEHPDKARDKVSSRPVADTPASVVPGPDAPDAPIDAAGIPAAPPVEAEVPPQPSRPTGRVAVRWSGESLLHVSRRLAIAALVLLVAGGTAWVVVANRVAIARRVSSLVPKPRTGTVNLLSVPASSSVVIDGKPSGQTPLSAQLAAGQHVVEFQRGTTSRRVEITVTAGQSIEERVDWTATPMGRLDVQSDPPGATVVIDGVRRGVTPLSATELPVGPHQVRLESAEGVVSQRVDIRVDETATLSQAIFSGWIHVSSPIDVEIALGSRAVRLDSRNEAMLPPGIHDLFFENRALGYSETRRVEVRPGALTRVVITPPMSMLTVSATLPAVVLVDGEEAGQTPLANHPVSLGTHDVVVRSTSGLEQQFAITFTVKPVQLDVDFRAP